MEIGDRESHVGNLSEVGIELGCPRLSTSNRDPCLKVGTVLTVRGSSQEKEN